MRLIVSATTVLMIAAFGILLTPTAEASAATPTCTSGSQFTDSDAQQVWIPTVGYQTDNADCQLALGNDNDAVKILQNDLNACYRSGLTIDGSFGSLTKAALQAAQRRAGISADGIYGPQTRDNIHWIDAGGNCAILPV